MASPRRSRWLLPITLLVGAAAAIFGVLYAIDLSLAGAGAGYLQFDPDHITDAVGSLSGLFAAVLGILLTVVSIIVQLSSDRYTNVTQMFFRDRTNLAVLGFYVLCCIWGVAASFSVHEGFVPRVTIAVMIGLAAVSFAVMAPYFAYVFEFLQPENIIARIRRDAVDTAAAGARTMSDRQRASTQAAALHALEELTDITINSIQGRDKLIAIAGVDALKDFSVAYLRSKARAEPEWFVVGPGIRKNPDFVSMAPESINDLERRGTWVEWKVLRQYQAIFADGLTSMRDVVTVVGIDTRYVGETAIWAEDQEALALCLKFMNSYLRAALNAKDVRSAYNLLHQYRTLAEALLRAGWHARAREAARYLRYYGHVAARHELDFVTETAAYDLGALCELAHRLRSPVEDDLLATFLEVDEPPEGAAQQTRLRGVRKAQVKLATFYLHAGADALARRIFADMQHERPERLRSIRDELAKVESADFWEVVDRGTNFDYLPPERKAALGTFFAWFPRIAAELQAPRVQSTQEGSS